MALVIGHRGAKALAAENTLQGIKSAASCRADYVELDVRISRDGELVLMHDESVDRTTNGKGLVQDMSLEELKALDVSGQEIPTLAEAFALAKEFEIRPHCGDERRRPRRAGGRGFVRQQLHGYFLLSLFLARIQRAVGPINWNHHLIDARKAR